MFDCSPQPKFFIEACHVNLFYDQKLHIYKLELGQFELQVYTLVSLNEEIASSHEKTFSLSSQCPALK